METKNIKGKIDYKALSIISHLNPKQFNQLRKELIAFEQTEFAIGEYKKKLMKWCSEVRMLPLLPQKN